MATKTVNRDVANLRKSVERLDAAQTERIATASPGDVVRQGDLYLVCLESPTGGEIIHETQLAPGNTQGSRHVVEGDCVIRRGPEVVKAVQALHGTVPMELVGPSLECDSDCTVTHPQHGHRILPSGSSWAVVYQRQFAEDIRRMQD